MLDSGTEGPGFKSQSRRCRVTVLAKLFTPIVPLFTNQQNWKQGNKGATREKRQVFTFIFSPPGCMVKARLWAIYFSAVSHLFIHLFLTIPVRPIIAKSTGPSFRQIFRVGRTMAVDD